MAQENATGEMTMTTRYTIAIFNPGYLFAGDSWNRDANNNVILNQSVTLTWSILTGMPSYYSFSPPNPRFPTSANFSPFTDLQISAAERARTSWSSYANITWQQSSPGTTGQVTFGNYAFEQPAERKIDGRGFFPRIDLLLSALGLSQSHGGDVWIASNGALPTETLQAAMGNYGYYLLLHEIGHALGLAHDGVFTLNTGLAAPASLQPDQAEPLFTVMFDAQRAAISGLPLPITPMMYDIAQIQRLYGVQTNVNVGDTTYTFANDANPTHPFVTQEMGAVYRDPGKVMMTLWDPDGAQDKIDASGMVTPVLINLTPGTFSAIGTSGKTVFNVGIALNPPSFENNRTEQAIGGSGADDLIGNDVANVLEGNGGADDLKGGAGDDTLYGERASGTLNGEAGDDTLEGGTGSDTLHGGAGRDTYIWKTGDGNDQIIEDASRDGEIRINDQAPKTFQEVAGSNDTVYISSDGTLSLTHQSPWTLVLPDGSTIDLGETLNDGDFGINLRDARDPHTYADLGPLILGDENGNTLTGTALADPIQSLGGNDTINAGAGDDSAEGGDGDDFVYGGAGFDRLYGGAGGDFLDGGADDDELYGGAGDDWLFASGGDDYLDGGADNDVLFGENGFDVLFGGAGDDVINGDDAALDAALHGDDYLDGEDGNDKLYGSGGADDLFGGSGSDKLFGDDAISVAYQGADYLSGEDGDDELWGFGGDD